MKTMRAVVVLQGWAALLTSCIAFAGVNSWTALGPEGGLVQSALYHPRSPHTLFTIVGYAVHRSTDEGQHWQAIPLGTDPYLATQIVADPSNANRLYAIGSLTFYASTDGGATFALRPSAGRARQVAVASDGTVFALDDAGTASRSTDAGQTWQVRGQVTAVQENIGPLVVDPTDSSRLYVTSSQSGLYASTDAGASWQRRGLANVADLSYVRELLVDPHLPTRLWANTSSKLMRSVDGGNTWSTMLDTNLTPPYIYAIALDPLVPGTVYSAGGDGAIRRSTDAGASWSVIATVSLIPSVLAVNPANPAQLLVGTGTGIEIVTLPQTAGVARNTGVLAAYADKLAGSPNQDRTYFVSNLGLTWLDQNLQPVAANNAQLNSQLRDARSPLSLHVPDGPGDTLFVAGDGVVTRSTDGGQNWTRLTTPSEGFYWLTGPRSDARVLYVGGYSTVLSKSIDGGTSWSDLAISLPAAPDGSTGNIPMMAVGGDPNVLYIGGPWGVYRSGDAGATWQARNTGIANRAVYRFAIDPRNDNRLIVASGRNLSRTLDGGVTWSDVGPAITSSEALWDLRVDGTNPDIVYAVTTQRLLRSIDAGASWESAPVPARYWEMLSVHPDPRRLSEVHVGTRYGGVQQFTFGANLSVALSAPNTLAPGATATIAISARNNGPFDAPVARVVIQLPTTATPATGSAPGATCTTAAERITCELGAFRSNTVVPITVTATPSGTGAFTASATISATIADTLATDNSDSVSITVAEPTPAPPPSPPGPGTGGTNTTTATGGGGSTSAGWLLGLLLLVSLRASALRAAVRCPPCG